MDKDNHLIGNDIKTEDEYREIIKGEFLKALKSLDFFLVVQQKNGEMEYGCEKIYTDRGLFKEKIEKIKESDFEFDFINPERNRKDKMNISIPHNLSLRFIKLLFENKDLPIDLLKRIKIEDDYSLKSWGDLLKYKWDTDLDWDLVFRRYEARLNKRDIENIFYIIYSKSIEASSFLSFIEKHISYFNEVQIVFISNYFKNCEDPVLLKKFKEFTQESGVDIEAMEDIFKEKENNFSYLNIDAKQFKKVFYFEPFKGLPAKENDFVWLIKNGVKFLLKNKKKLNIEEIKYINMSEKSKEYLLAIKPSNKDFNKEDIKKFFIEYSKSFIHEIEVLNEDKEIQKRNEYEALRNLKDKEDVLFNNLYLQLKLNEKNNGKDRVRTNRTKI